MASSSARDRHARARKARRGTRADARGARRGDGEAAARAGSTAVDAPGTHPGRAERTVALRSADAALIEQVRAVCELVQVGVLLCPPGAAPPHAALLLDSTDERAPDHPPWEGRAIGVRLPAGRDTGPDTALHQGRDPAGQGAPAVLVLPEQGEELVRRIRAAVQVRRAHVVGVLGARGGLGASSLASVLSRAVAQHHHRTALVDLDSVGTGLDLLLGIEEVPGVRWADLTAPAGDYDSSELTAALPVWRDVRVLSADWRGGVPAPGGGAVLEALWADLDVVVLDIARHHGWHQWAGLCDELVVLAGCDVMSAAGVQSSRRALGAAPVRLVVRGPAPGGLTAREVAQACDLPLTTQMRAERSLSAAMERGVAPGDHSKGPLMRTGRALARTLGLADPATAS